MSARVITAMAAASSLLVLAASPGRAAPQEFEVDRSHTYIGFVIDNFGFSKVVGRFNEFRGRLMIDEADPAASTVEVTVDTRTIDTNFKARDEHVRSKDFLDVARFPEMVFKSTAVEMTGEGAGRLTGDLTLKGVTKPVTLDFKLIRAEPYTDLLPDYKRAFTAAFEASGRLKRSDWGFDYLVGPVGDEVELEIRVDAVRCAGEAAQSPQCAF